MLIHWSYYHESASDEENMFEYMTKVANIAPDEITYTIIVDGLCRQGKFDRATDCFKEPLKDGLSKDLLTALINRLGHRERIWNNPLSYLRKLEDKVLSVITLYLRVQLDHFVGLVFVSAQRLLVWNSFRMEYWDLARKYTLLIRVEEKDKCSHATMPLSSLLSNTYD
ncbi:hypothetical protein SEVIR_9G180150v4 [Setaria viridis]